MITKNTRLRRILLEKEFEEYKQYLLPWKKGIILHLKIKSFQSMWNVDSIVDGFNYMKRLESQEKKIFYPIYDLEDSKNNPSLKERVLFHFPVKEKTKFVVICAGGGYESVCSFVEAFPVAQRLNELGYHAFVVNYRVGKDAAYPNPMDDLANAISYVLNHAGDFNVEKEDYAVMGFSAGGHLAGSFGTEQIGYQKYDLPKPGAMLLAYPVITMGKYTHEGSRKYLLGESGKQDSNERDALSIEKLVTKEYPACYIWQCDKDPTVPIENSKMMAAALRQNEVSYQYEVFKGKAHGWGLAKGTTAEGWLEHAIDFWKENSNVN